MHGADFPPRSDVDQEADEFWAILERNALARWWRDHAGASGETGARLIARDIPATTTDESDPIGLDD